jgi:hypothetical protein
VTKKFNTKAGTEFLLTTAGVYSEVDSVVSYKEKALAFQGLMKLK